MNAELLAGNIAVHWVQAGSLAMAAIIALRFLQLNEPRARLAALHIVLVAILLLPIMQPWRVDEAGPLRAGATVSEVSTVISESSARVPRDIAQTLTVAQAMFAIVAAGIVIRLSWLFYGLIGLAKFSRTASEVPPPAFASELEAALRVSPRYVQQTGSRGPMTFGFLRPIVALPAGFDALLPEHQRAVICHELIHAKRRDIVVAFLEEIAVAALWFHPWIWMLRARIRVAREQVVDRCVVTILGNRDEYVRCLVDLSGHDLAPHCSHAGAGMLHPRELRARVDAMFQEVPMSRMRIVVSTLTFAALTIVTGIVAVAALPLRTVGVPHGVPSEGATAEYVVSGFSRTKLAPQAAQPRASSDAPRKQINKIYPEYPTDALERGIKGIVMVDITVNAAGDVTTAAVASGPQELRASAFKAALGLKFSPGPTTVAMQVAFEYTLSADSWGVRIGDASRTGARASAASVAPSRQTNSALATAHRITGDMRRPTKTKDVPPMYPAAAQQARVQGVVDMEARIDENGNVSDVRVLRSIPMLDEAAMDAVKQWQYTPTLMNGAPVPVLLTVTVSFSLRKLIELHAVLPDGSSTVIGLSGNGLIEFGPGPGARFHLRARVSEDSNEAAVSVFADDGETHLGDLTLVIGGPVVQTPTNPSVGLQFLGVR